MYLFFRQTAVQKALDLCQQPDVLHQTAFIHPGGQLIQVFQYLRLFGFTCGAVFAQLLCQKVNIRSSLLDIFLLEHRQSDIRKQFGIF